MRRRQKTATRRLLTFSVLTILGFAGFVVHEIQPVEMAMADVSRGDYGMSLAPGGLRPVPRPDPALRGGGSEVGLISHLAKPQPAARAAATHRPPASAMLSALSAMPDAGDPLPRVTSHVLESLGEAAPRAMQDMVVGALRQGESDARIDRMLNEAAEAGRIEVPRALRTAGGRVDTETLLRALVTRSHLAAEAEAHHPPAHRRATPVVRAMMHRVGPEDSLAALALRYYGDVADYGTIFAANRDRLSTADRIRIGQTLVIPPY